MRPYFDLVDLVDEEGRTYQDISLESQEDQRLAAEEYIAHLAEKGVKPSWWKELLQKMRMAFAKLPYFSEVSMTDRQIELVLARSARKVRKGGKYLAQDGGGKRFSIIGEKGAANLDRYNAQNNLDNLAVAKEMLDSGKNDRAVKLATGWEKGGDGKWRMEVPDLEIITKRKLPDGTEYTVDSFAFFDGYLEELVDAPELFAAYGPLRRLKVRSADIETAGSYSEKNNTIYFSFDHFVGKPAARQEVDLRELLVHEVQHAIQHIEGFARGGSFADKNYNNLAGEVEARNAAKRSYYSMDERREMLLSLTEDVAEESKVYLFENDGESSFAEPFTDDQKRRIASMAHSNGVDVVKKILYGGSITRNGNTVHFDGKNSHPLKLHLEAPGFNPQRGGVTIEDIEKFLPLALAQEAKIEKRKNKKGKITSNKIYKIAENGVIYTLVTASRGEFRSFYSNKKAANAVTDPNRSSATGMLHNDNIPQISENTSQTDENGRKRTGCASRSRSIRRRSSGILLISLNHLPELSLTRIRTSMQSI